MSLFTDLREVFTAYAQRIKGLAAADEEIKADLGTISGNEQIPLISGGYIPLNVGVADIENPRASDAYSYAVVPCSKDDEFTINASGRETAKPWGFITDDGTVLVTANASSATTDTVMDNAVIVAPENAAYLVINNRGAGVSYKGIMLVNKVSEISKELLSDHYDDMSVNVYNRGWAGNVGEEIQVDTAGTNWRRTKIDIVDGATYDISVIGFGTQNAIPYIWLCDDDNNILSRIEKLNLTSGSVLNISMSKSEYGEATKAYVRGYFSGVETSDDTIKVKINMSHVLASTIKCSQISTGAILGQNVIPITLVSEPTATQNRLEVIVDNESVVIRALDGSANFGAITPKGTLQSYIQSGKKYRMHAHVDVLSGTPAPLIAIVGVSGNQDGLNQYFFINDGETKEMDFIADENMSHVKFILSLTAGASGNAIKVSDFWIKEIEGETAIDEGLRKTCSGHIADKYKNEMDATLQSVYAAMDEPCLVFAQLTDIHHLSANTQSAWNTNQFLDTVENIRYASEHIQLDGVICLGDITDGGQDSTPKTVAAGIPIIHDMFRKFRRCSAPLFFSVGNHDDFRYATIGMDAGEIYARYMSQSSKDVVTDSDAKGTNYYKDYPYVKVRLICINTNVLPDRNIKGKYGISTETAAFLAETLNSMPNDYIAFLITHAPLYTEMIWKTASTIPNIDRVQTAISSSGKTVIATTGHCHFDTSYYPAGGFLCVTSQCAKFEGPDVDTEYTTRGEFPAYRFSRSRDDATGDSWDVVIVKPNSGKVEYLRFGAGKDRIFNYIPVVVSDSYTFSSELDGALTWSSNDPSIATVSDGVLTAVAQGRAQISAKDNAGNTEYFYVDVVN